MVRSVQSGVGDWVTGEPKFLTMCACAQLVSPGKGKEKNQMDVALSAIYTWDGVGIGSLG